MSKKLITIVSFMTLLMLACSGGASSTAVRDHRLTVGTATMDDFIEAMKGEQAVDS